MSLTEIQLCLFRKVYVYALLMPLVVLEIEMLNVYNYVKCRIVVAVGKVFYFSLQCTDSMNLQDFHFRKFDCYKYLLNYCY